MSRQLGQSRLSIMWRLAWPAIIEQILATMVSYVDTAMVGQLGEQATAAVSVTTTITWLTPHGDAVKLMSPKKHQLDMRVAEEYWDVEQADVGLWADKYVMIVRPKTTTPGTVAPMASADTSGEYVVYYFAAYKNGEQLWEVDKRNMRCVILGVDYMAEVRKALGK